MPHQKKKKEEVSTPRGRRRRVKECVKDREKRKKRPVYLTERTGADSVLLHSGSELLLWPRSQLQLEPEGLGVRRPAACYSCWQRQGDVQLLEEPVAIVANEVVDAAQILGTGGCCHDSSSHLQRHLVSEHTGGSLQDIRLWLTKDPEIQNAKHNIYESFPTESSHNTLAGITQSASFQQTLTLLHTKQSLMGTFVL